MYTRALFPANAAYMHMRMSRVAGNIAVVRTLGGVRVERKIMLLQRLSEVRANPLRGVAGTYNLHISLSEQAC